MKLNTKNLRDIEIGFTVLNDGVYFARITKAEVAENKARTGSNLRLQFSVLDPVVYTKEGKEVSNKGQVVLSQYISLVETPDYDPNGRLKEVAVAINLGEDDDLNVEDLQGKVVKLKVKYRPAKDGYNESNDIGRIMPVKENDVVPGE